MSSTNRVFAVVRPLLFILTTVLLILLLYANTAVMLHINRERAEFRSIIRESKEQLRSLHEIVDAIKEEAL
ncbi:hypothetical protein Hypma_014537 [Hypsizygus marmoreus]|uniref:Uncharacterized protein n=1 Tax=Hypsizygus marmoreus TaxID=39966 RepID=A0A369JJ69_HYPMA|nr:hypothetical protein Hypma_014537 [Hypsizygus marmoreus]